MRILAALLVVMFASFTHQKKTRVIFFGDSITEQGARPGGYIQKIDSLSKLENVSDRFEFIGAGVSGNKVYDLYLRLEEDVISKKPDVVIIYVGINDVWHKSILQTGTDPDKFEKFYLAILKRLKENNIRAILCTPTVIGEKTDFSNPQDGDLNRYSNITRKIAKEQGLPLVDLRKFFLEYSLKNNNSNKESGILTTDRVHLNSAGNLLVARGMWALIKLQ